MTTCKDRISIRARVGVRICTSAVSPASPSAAMRAAASFGLPANVSLRCSAAHSSSSRAALPWSPCSHS